MHCKKSFKKIRIRRKTRIFVDKSIAQLIDKRNYLLEEGSEKDLKEIDSKIAELEALEIRSNKLGLSCAKLRLARLASQRI
jgi:hypothetical protein